MKSNQIDLLNRLHYLEEQYYTTIRGTLGIYVGEVLEHEGENFGFPVPHGKGKYTWKDGEYYEGEWKFSKKHGFGVRKYKNGIYYGTFLSDKKNGKGRYEFYNGDFYEGEYLNDKATGKGILKIGHFKYIGYFKNGQINGKGILIELNKNEMITGTFKDFICLEGIHYDNEGKVFKIKNKQPITNKSIDQKKINANVVIVENKKIIKYDTKIL